MKRKGPYIFSTHPPQGEAAELEDTQQRIRRNTKAPEGGRCAPRAVPQRSEDCLSTEYAARPQERPRRKRQESPRHIPQAPPPPSPPSQRDRPRDDARRRRPRDSERGRPPCAWRQPPRRPRHVRRIPKRPKPPRRARTRPQAPPQVRSRCPSPSPWRCAHQ